MKKKKVNLKQLVLKKSSVASLDPNSVTGGFQSWTGTAEPCFLTEDGCGGGTTNCGTNNCVTNNCGTAYCATNGCVSNYCGTTNIGCNSDSICPRGIQCY